MRFSTASVVTASLLLGEASAALPPIVMKGSKFFYENGTEFFIKGVAYQQEFEASGGSSTTGKYKDPLADVENCKRDVPLLQALHTNTIRTYAVDPDADHDECMKLLDDAGIYVISDLSEPGLSINREDPHWNVELYERYTSVVKNLGQYSNVIGFFAGNEVTNNKTNTDASAYVKAAVRDTKAYIKKNMDRWIGVGYAANDDADIRANIAHYFNCGDETDAIDFWGYNIYEWCGHSTIEKSGYGEQVDFFKNYSVPVFFAEYGCNIPTGDGRIWEETTALYSKEMTDVLSGGIVYMYFQEANDYGLVSIKNDEASTMKNYNALKTRLASVSPSATTMDDYKPTNSPAECPDVGSTWKVKGSALPPTPDSSLCNCMFSSISCAPADDLSAKDIGTLFGYICGEAPEICKGIEGNTTNGVYGAYSMCNSKQQLGYVLDAYYSSQNKASTACDFKGMAVVQDSTVDEDKCGEKLKAASSVNAVAATATGAEGNGGVPVSTDAAETSESFAAPAPMQSMFRLGDLAIGLYVVVAMGVGAGMVLL